MKMRLYNVLDYDRKSYHCGSHTWTPGEWVRVEGELVPFECGIHLFRDEDLIDWLGPEIWAAEYREDVIILKDKVVVREARILSKYDNWNEMTARLLACYFAEKVLLLCSDDSRPAEAIKVARLYARGQVTKQELISAQLAAWEAAQSASQRVASASGSLAEEAAAYAAWSTTHGEAWEAATCAAWNVIRSAARDAIQGAAYRNEALNTLWSAATATMKEWQTKQLMLLLHQWRHDGDET